MSSVPSSTSSASGSTSNAPDGSGRTFTPSFTGQFGSMSPAYNSDGSIKGIYDLQGNLYARGGGSRNSVLGASPSLLNASSFRAPPPSSMGNTARGVSVSRSLNSSGGTQIRILQRQGPPQGHSVPGSSYPTAGGASQTNVQAMSSLSSASSMTGSPQGHSVPGSSYPTTGGHSQTNIQAMSSISSMTGPPHGYSVPGSSYPTAEGHFQTNVQGMSSPSFASSMTGPPKDYSVSGSSYPNAGGYSQTNVQVMSSPSFASSMTELPQSYSLPGSFYPTVWGHSQTHVQAMSSLSYVSSMTGSSTDHQMNLHHKEVMMQSQQSSMGRHGEFYFGGASTPHYPPQLEHAQAVSSSGGISSQMGRHGELYFGGASTPHYPPQLQHAQAVSSSGGISSQTGGSRSVNAPIGYDQIFQHHQNTSEQRGKKPSAIGQPIGDVGSSQPTQAALPQSAPDPYGMLGLLDVLKRTNPDVATLAIGMDLTEMGLDMTSKEDLFKTFASPWTNEPVKDGPYDFTLPECYNEVQLPPLHKGMFRRFKPITLFYIFYCMPQDEAQLFAADELYNRGWFYHKEQKCWYIRIEEPLVITNEYERGTYNCFDPQKFEMVQQANIFIYYENLEKRPSLPEHRV